VVVKILPFLPQNYGFPLFPSWPGPVILSPEGGRIMSRLIKILHIDILLNPDSARLMLNLLWRPTRAISREYGQIDIHKKGGVP
jgi:hypothetical protein